MLKIDYIFKNEKLLTEAISHSSYANEKKTGHCNERLEFLGDSILSMVTARYLFLNNPGVPEGKLTKMRAALVCEKTLAKFAKTIDLGSALLLGKGEEHGNGRNRPSILADAFEALIAAIYLDSGYKNAENFILGFIKNEQIDTDDYKSLLQEVIQRNPDEKVDYFVTDEKGPDHDKTFTVEVHLNSNVIGHGSGRTKKQAEQQAAKEALQLMGVI
ncbi:MAG: ribonuclease III [Oscillospiraceae bacterium]|jgi:ribonuclease-3|nr:ribonuclease III [Oscillospiraceae bacterium]